MWFEFLGELELFFGNLAYGLHDLSIEALQKVLSFGRQISAREKQSVLIS